MKITVRTIVRLGGHLPPGRTAGQGTEIALDAPPDSTPADIIRELGLSDERLYLVKVNAKVLPLAQQSTARLRDGDSLTILPKPKYG